MKKAFTLSEALVTLAIIGVLAAILIPVVNNVKPDKDKILYKKALYTLTNAVSEAAELIEYEYASGNVAGYWDDPNTADNAFCKRIFRALRATNEHCDIPQGTSTYEEPNFITVDGTRYWGLEGRFDGKVRDIRVDRPMSTSELEKIRDAREGIADGVGLRIQVYKDGKVDVPDNDYEQELVEYGSDMSTRRYGAN